MAETVSVGCPSVAQPATVSASSLAQHLDCSRAYVTKLEADGVLHARAIDMGRFFATSGHIQLEILALKGWSWSCPKPKRACKNAWLSLLAV
jgi:hypothetical protein